MIGRMITLSQWEKVKTRIPELLRQKGQMTFEDIYSAVADCELSSDELEDVLENLIAANKIKRVDDFNSLIFQNFV